MLIVLDAVSGGGSIGRVQLRSGQSARVGKSAWVELSLPHDADLCDEQFEISNTPQGCLIRRLDPSVDVLLNGDPVEAVYAYNGDRLQAGQSTFALRIQDGPPRPDPEEEEQPLPAETELASAAVSLAGVCSHLGFPDEVQAAADAATSADDLIEQMASEGHPLEALRLRAYLLDRRAAIWWASLCLRDLEELLPNDQLDGLAAAERWVESPGDPARRDAEARAVAADYVGPGASLALAVFWSGGSVGPQDGFVSEPDERMLSQATASALMSAAYLGDPALADSRVGAFLQRGREMADGEIPLPDDSAQGV